MASELGVANNCIFTGALPHDEVLQHMSRAWCTLFPTLSEAFGTVGMESISVGTPVIASRVGGIPEVIRDGLEGILVPPNNPERLAEAITRLLMDDNLHESMSVSCRQRFLDMFERNKVINDQANWFQNLILDARNKIEISIRR